MRSLGLGSTLTGTLENFGADAELRALPLQRHLIHHVSIRRVADPFGKAPDPLSDAS